MDVEKTPGTNTSPHPTREGYRLKRVSLVISSRKHPGQTFVGYALLHEFDPRRMSFFTAHKFPVDDEIEIQTDFFGSRAVAKAIMTNIHEQISSGRVMNAVPDESNPFPVRKFYRCFAEIRSLHGALPGMHSVSSETSPGEPLSKPTESSVDPAGGTSMGAPKLSAVPDAAPSAVNETPTAGSGAPSAAPPMEAEPSKESMVEATVKPKDSDDIKAKLAALSDPNAIPPASSEKLAA
jgi:hypothetical protein